MSLNAGSVTLAASEWVLSPMVFLYAAFVGFIVIMLALDLFVVNRKAHVIRSREALQWTAVTVVMALLFGVAVYFMYENDWPEGIVSHIARATERQTGHGAEAAAQYITGWIVEYSLSVDNIFVIAVIFSYFRVAKELQHRVLFWGILGALVMRGAMIGIGAGLMKFHWINYFFGALLIFTAIRLLLAGETPPDPERNWGVRLARRYLPVSPSVEGDRFFTRIPAPARPERGPRTRFAVTPLFLVLIVVETTDVIFAVDSIPAIFALTRDPFLVFTSNVFAILGLRSLYFALAAIIDSFHYLKTSLVFVLGFIGVKMLLTDAAEIPTLVSLAVVVGMLVVGVLASILSRKGPKPALRAPEEQAEAERLDAALHAPERDE